MWERIQKLLDRFESRWALGILVAGSGAVTARLAALSDWLNAWGPIGWGAAGLIGALVVAFCYYLISFGYARWTVAREARRIIDRAGINPLADHFETQSIVVTDLFNRDYIPHEGKTFRNCYLQGPASVFISGGSMIGVTFKNCQVVLIREPIAVVGVTAFRECLFTGGYMSNLTLMMPRKNFEAMPESVRRGIRVLNDR
jgi:hypothetical protein